jgi:hypothetical protein
MNIRLLPPTGAAYQTIAVKGRSYTAAPGSFLDVMDSDAQVLAANGWVWVSPSGPTSARPAGTLPPYAAVPGVTFFDKSINKYIIFDGASWRDPANGNSV